ncbi:MAG: LytTR family DNA-binding domain-containing protein [Tunicatimonas sp.]
MTRLRSVIIDDERAGIENLNHILRTVCPEVEVIGSASTLTEAERLLRNTDPELVFLDVQLGTQTAFQLLERLEDTAFEIIFVSAHDHALTAIKFMAIDYLLKPIDLEALREAVTRAVYNQGHRNFYDHARELIASVRNPDGEHHKIAVPTQDGYEFVLTKDILYCTASGSYTTLQLQNNRQLMASQILKHYEELLGRHKFIRIHNSHLVNVRRIKSISRADGGYVIMEDNQRLPVSKSRKESLLAELRLK